MIFDMKSPFNIITITIGIIAIPFIFIFSYFCFYILAIILSFFYFLIVEFGIWGIIILIMAFIGCRM